MLVGTLELDIQLWDVCGDVHHEGQNLLSLSSTTGFPFIFLNFSRRTDTLMQFIFVCLHNLQNVVSVGLLKNRVLENQTILKSVKFLSSCLAFFITVNTLHKLTLANLHACSFSKNNSLWTLYLIFFSWQWCHWWHYLTRGKGLLSVYLFPHTAENVYLLNYLTGMFKQSQGQLVGRKFPMLI